jgi:hypothetical protein
MANTLLTPDMILRESMRILHQKCNFIGNITRKYDSSFAKEGAKIGDTLRVRLPNEYVVTDGPTMSGGGQDTVEQSVSLPVTNQKHVGMNFTSADLTLSLDDFSSRIIEPAMARLAANVEADALTMINSVANMVDQDGSAFTLNTILNGRKRLNDSLAPMDNSRTALLSTEANVKVVDQLKGLFQDSTEIAKQYKEGMMGRTAGFNFYENTLLLPHTTGTANKTTGYLTNGASQTGSTLVIDTGSTSFLVGDRINIAGVFDVHPETKQITGKLKQFVVTANSGTSATSLSISPSIVATGARQNVSVAVPDGAAIIKLGAANGETTGTDIVFHKDAFLFATADLVMPSGVDFAARKNIDGISMRIVRQYDIKEDRFPCRVDILYGYVAARPELACVLHADG